MWPERGGREAGVPSVVVRAERLGKRYRVGVEGMRQSPGTLKEALARRMRAPLSNLAQLRRLDTFGGAGGSDAFWALRDVSFEVRRGEVLGVIGRNGAGKSTLLKVLSRITRPTEGRAEVRGRVGSLLEVGTGFHPELSGRDNIYLNGSILGMSRRQIDGKFDAIVAFAGVERFIDVPVKRYSSGMYLRLAFAVAAHLEPDVLIVDEVLAVGDLEFQRRCLGRMDEVARSGRTVLFVSHNLQAVQRLCPRTLLIEGGQVALDGATRDVLNRYLASGGSRAVPGRWHDVTPARRSGSGAARFTSVHFDGGNPEVANWPYTGGPLTLQLRIQSDNIQPQASIAVYLADRYGTNLLNADTDSLGEPITLPEGESTWRLAIEQVHLKQGAYVLGLWLADRVGEPLDEVEAALHIEVLDLSVAGVGARVDSRYDGVVACRFAVEQATGSSCPPIERREREWSS